MRNKCTSLVICFRAVGERETLAAVRDTPIDMMAFDTRPVHPSPLHIKNMNSFYELFPTHTSNSGVVEVCAILFKEPLVSGSSSKAIRHIAVVKFNDWLDTSATNVASAFIHSSSFIMFFESPRVQQFMQLWYSTAGHEGVWLKNEDDYSVWFSTKSIRCRTMVSSYTPANDIFKISISFRSEPSARNF